jgi:hypothetical protein
LYTLFGLPPLLDLLAFPGALFLISLALISKTAKLNYVEITT